MVDNGMFAREIELMNVSGAENIFLLSFLNDRTRFVCGRRSEHDIQNRCKKDKIHRFRPDGQTERLIHSGEQTDNGTAIERVTNQVYTHGERLTWSEHIDAVLKKLRPMFFAIKISRYILDDKQLWSL
jgi:hypothetical protein